MTQKYTTVTLPCKSYIKKFVHYLYGPDIIIDSNSSFGCYITVMLEKKLYLNRLTGYYKDKGLEDCLTLHIDPWTRDKIGFDFAPEKVIMANRMLEEFFKESLYIHCATYIKNYPKASRRDNGYKLAIEQYADMLGLSIELDVNYDTLKKMEYRYRKKRSKGHRAQKISQLFSVKMSPIKNTPPKEDLPPGEIPDGYTKAPDFSDN